jgi:hypothetical protein
MEYVGQLHWILEDNRNENEDDQMGNL